MIVGGVLVFLSQVYVGVLKNVPGLAAIFGVFGGMIAAIGGVVYHHAD